LIAGEYVNELNDNKSALIASTNQELICLNDKLQERYRSYQEQGRQIQNVYYKHEMMSVGIHNREERI
jgi:site-specific DNA-adenine methylase